MALTMDTACVADLELARRHHLVAGGKPFDDLHPALAARADHDFVSLTLHRRS